MFSTGVKSSSDRVGCGKVDYPKAVSRPLIVRLIVRVSNLYIVIIMTHNH